MRGKVLFLANYSSVWRREDQSVVNQFGQSGYVASQHCITQSYFACENRIDRSRIARHAGTGGSL